MRNEVLVSRSAVNIPEPDFTLNRGRAYEYSKLLAQGKTDTQFTPEEQNLRMSVSNPEHILATLYGADYIQNIKKASNSNKPEEELIREIEELENQALGVARRSEEIILPGQPKPGNSRLILTWSKVNKRPIYLRYRFMPEKVIQNLTSVLGESATEQRSGNKWGAKTADHRIKCFS